MLILFFPLLNILLLVWNKCDNCYWWDCQICGKIRVLAISQKPSFLSLKYVHSTNIKMHFRHLFGSQFGHISWKKSSISYRACHFCYTSDRITLDLLNELPLSDIIKEEEVHLLEEGSVYEEIRQRNSTELHSLLTNSQFSKLFEEKYILETMSIHFV